MPTLTQHSYRCYTYPWNLPTDQVEMQASTNTMNFVQIKASNAESALTKACILTGHCVHRVERIEAAMPAEVQV